MKKRIRSLLYEYFSQINHYVVEINLSRQMKKKIDKNRVFTYLNTHKFHELKKTRYKEKLKLIAYIQDTCLAHNYYNKKKF